MAGKKKVGKKKKSVPKEIEAVDLASIPLEELLEEIRRRNLTCLLVSSEEMVNINIGELPEDEEPEEPEEPEEEPEEPEEEPEAEPEEEPEEIEVGSEVTWEDDSEGTLQGTVRKIKKNTATVDVEAEGETYEYGVAVEEMTVVASEEKEGNGDDDNGDSTDAANDWSEYSIDNLGFKKPIQTKLGKAGIESIGELTEALKKPKAFKAKAKLSDAEIGEIKKALKDLDE